MKFQKALWKADRIDAGFTQGEEAELLGCSNQHISDIETGKRNPSKKIVAAKADLYGRKGRYYYGIDDDKIFDKCSELFLNLLGKPHEDDTITNAELIRLIIAGKKLEHNLNEPVQHSTSVESDMEIERHRQQQQDELDDLDEDA